MVLHIDVHHGARYRLEKKEGLTSEQLDERLRELLGEYYPAKLYLNGRRLKPGPAQLQDDMVFLLKPGQSCLLAVLMRQSCARTC